MKKILSFLLFLAVIVNLCACGSKSAVSVVTAEKAQEPSAAVASGAAEQKADNPDNGPWGELEKAGRIETIEGLKYASVTIPAEFSEGAAQELLDSSAGTSYTSAKLNDNGSVTYKLTEKQYNEMLSGMKQMIDENLQEFVDTENLAFTKIVPNQDYTAFDVYISTKEIGANESFMTLALGMYSELYNVFTVNSSEDVSINIYGPDGNLIKTAAPGDA